MTVRGDGLARQEMCYVGADGTLHDEEIWAEILGADDQRTIEIQKSSLPSVDGEAD